MPSKPLRPCNAPRCPNLTRGKYCVEHGFRDRELAADRDTAYDRNRRDPRVTEFYKSQGWRNARQFVLERDRHLCRLCLEEKRITAAKIVHHKVELDPNDPKAWELRLNASNLVSVCHACHNMIHK